MVVTHGYSHKVLWLLIVLLEQPAFHLGSGCGVEKTAWRWVHSEYMSNHVSVFNDFFHYVVSVESFCRLDLVKEKIRESFWFVVVPPNVCRNFPKHINVNIQIFKVFLNFVNDPIDFARVQVVVPDHDQNEVFQNPNFVLILGVAQRIQEFFFVIETTFQWFETPFKTNFVLNLVNWNRNLVVKFLFYSFQHLHSFFEASQIWELFLIDLNFEDGIVEEVKPEELIFGNFFISEEKNVFNSFPVDVVSFDGSNFFSELGDKIFGRVCEIKIVLNNSFFCPSVENLDLFDLAHADLSLDDGLVKVLSLDLERFDNIWNWRLLINGQHRTQRNRLVVFFLDWILDFFSVIVIKSHILFIVFVDIFSFLPDHIYECRLRSRTTQDERTYLCELFHSVSGLHGRTRVEKWLYLCFLPVNHVPFFAFFFLFQLQFYRFAH